MLDIFARAVLGKFTENRTSALQPMLWLTLLFVGLLISALKLTDNIVIVYTLMAFIGLILLVTLCVFVYFSITKPEFLRSEKFQTNKMAMENGYLGDAKYPFPNEEHIRELPKANAEAEFTPEHLNAEAEK